MEKSELERKNEDLKKTIGGVSALDEAQRKELTKVLPTVRGISFHKPLTHAVHKRVWAWVWVLGRAHEGGCSGLLLLSNTGGVVVFLSKAWRGMLLWRFTNTIPALPTRDIVALL